MTTATGLVDATALARLCGGWLGRSCALGLGGVAWADLCRGPHQGFPGRALGLVAAAAAAAGRLRAEGASRGAFRALGRPWILVLGASPGCALPLASVLAPEEA